MNDVFCFSVKSDADFGVMTMRTFPPLTAPVIAVGALSARAVMTLQGRRWSRVMRLLLNAVPLLSLLCLIVLLATPPLPTNATDRNYDVLLLFCCVSFFSKKIISINNFSFCLFSKT